MNSQPLTFNEWRRDNSGTSADYQVYRQGELDRHTFTRAVISAALNHAADLAQDLHEDERSDTIRTDDAVNLVVSTALHLLDHPGACLADAIAACYTDVELDIDDFTTDELDTCDFAGDRNEIIPPEKGSPVWNAALVRKVTGWLA